MNKSSMLNMLELALCSYSDTLPVCNTDICTTIVDSKTDTECFIHTKGNIMYIAFRGTDSKINRINNLCFCKKTIPYGNNDSKIRIHCGFLKGYASVRNKIHKLIGKHICEVLITGHSLGAALAVLCAVDIQYNFPDKDIEVYAFGCPRIGNEAFVKSYNKRVFKTLRFNNGNDIVTKIPPAIFGYRHVGTEIHTGKARLPLAISFSAHTPQNYYKNLWKDS